GGILEGHVIDFIHFTLRIDGYPVFPYIFNVADISISVAIISLLIFHQRILPVEDENEPGKNESMTATRAASGQVFSNTGATSAATDTNPVDGAGGNIDSRQSGSREDTVKGEHPGESATDADADTDVDSGNGTGTGTGTESDSEKDQRA
ncbi:MAG: signal peptidase II, partial [Balneolaceae bacterium]|nr:signal peptidase II [Balneolaceae bacterium]